MTSSITPEHIHDFVEVSSPTLLSDGSRLAFVKTWIDREAQTSRSQIMALSLPDGDPVPFTQGNQDTAPHFSPDESTLAFLRPDDNKQKQVWLLSTSGGEARQLTHLPGGVNDFSWSPDSTHLALVSPIDPNRPPDDQGPQTQVVRRIRYRHDEDGWKGDAFSHLFIASVQTGDTTQLTDGEGDDLLPAWSPDSTHLAFVTDRLENRDFVRNTEVRVIPMQGGNERIWSEGLCRIGALAWSPDGTCLAAIGAHDPDVWDSRQSWLYRLEPDQAPKHLTDGTYTVVLPDLRWTSDNRIVFIADKAGESYLCEIPPDGDLTPILGGNTVFSTLTLDANTHQAVTVALSPQSPGDLVLIDLSSQSQKQLTDYNRSLLDQHPPASFEKFSFARAGQDIQCRVFLPHDFDHTKQYPLILDIHGGPNGRFSDSFDITHQILTGAGYIVLAVNPRGSSSYGPDFLKAVLRDWGGEDFQDLMSAVDELCKRPYIDPNRLGVHGYSYGGFMSSWIVGHDHRFNAAVIGAPCINLHSMYGTSDIGVSFGENQWGGSSIDNPNVLLERSPLTYASHVQTPVLLMHGETDYRCPIEQSEQFFVALKRQNKPVTFVRFPHSSHGFRKSGHPKLREEYYRRLLDWFAQYV
ncbi:MAG: S9 family peptidase [bacterium]|nr:S9 family peptidase [bacterium]